MGRFAVSIKTKETLKILLIILVMVLIGRLILPILNSPEFKLFIESIGILGPIVIVLYVVLSHVFAPIVGSPMLFLSASVFGLGMSQIYFYLGGLFSSAINFWIARKYGRKWVEKLAGKSSMKDIDNFVAAEGTEVLFISRVFGFALFDFISYAAGLTKMKFKKYYIITNVVSMFTHAGLYFAYRNLDFKTEKGILIWSITLLTIATLFTFYIRKYLVKKSTK